MKILVFDTETTGLPLERNASINDVHKWPYIVQLSYILYDTETKMLIDYSDKIIRLPENIQISKESENIHKISNEMSQSKGVDINNELIQFNNMLEKADLVVGHNVSFDKQMIKVECVRNQLPSNFVINKIRKPEFCTMKNGVNITKIIKRKYNGDEYFKYPKLVELYKHLFGTVPDGLHNSMIDVLACLRCYGKMRHNFDYFKENDTLDMINSFIKIK
jgi:DNA polymerase III subunit epsilon